MLVIIASLCNPSQRDTDQDGLEDSCDNCVSMLNTNQADADADGFEDVCPKSHVYEFLMVACPRNTRWKTN
jgi:hypothetical protein